MFTRELVERDLGNPAPPRIASIRRIREQHHEIARLLAEGRKLFEISASTGYTSSYISALREDPAFGELLTYYRTIKRERFVVFQEKLGQLGTAAIEELMERLENDPKDFSNKELTALVGIIKGKAEAGNAPQVAPTFNISFGRDSAPAESGIIIEHEGR